MPGAKRRLKRSKSGEFASGSTERPGFKIARLPLAIESKLAPKEEAGHLPRIPAEGAAKYLEEWWTHQGSNLGPAD